ncbi:mannosyltransferase complex subunit [Schizosaccharomyces japonicus yFS275]|uniref:Mannosyltransferase complex subunit n=1 Tax=Schizosaccharomyces japonicus (strain yFS275 / FY16936) TaxID=402676 RepID=B6K084_SCHJY|nr:mannosyltransferase complex subunit [Schizosaccharomyces japonicus yFS275]EEB06234.1 mannosyltransferase complex subunit [Schizosaccharomyces japonicus yFS275]
MRCANKPRIIGLILSACLSMALLYHFLSPSKSYSIDLPVESSSSINIYDMNVIKATGDAARNKEQVLILTPIARFYQEYWNNILKLSYPRDLISLGFILPRGKQGRETSKKLRKAINLVQSGPANKRFAEVTIMIEDQEISTEQSESERHKFAAQKERRGRMAITRNTLLEATLTPTTAWVFWLDSDIVETPPTIIEDMTSHNKDVLVANCYQRYGKNQIREYDLNNWRESQTAIELAQGMSEDEIVVEGYHEIATYRPLFVYDREENGDPDREMELDGVGATALLVKAEVHRDGAMFPSFPFYHLIESEGFAKMAKRLNYQVWGLPNYLVYHYNE